MTYSLNERLCDLANCRHDDLSIGYEAANRIEELEVERDQLRAQINVLREALSSAESALDESRDYPVTYDEVITALITTPEQSLAAYRNKAADRIEELEAINEKLTDWVEKRKEDLTAAYRTIDYLRAELARAKK